MTDTKHSEAEAEEALNRLLDHLQNWLLTQPEALLLWTQPRSVRKEVSRLIAAELTTIPTRVAGEGEPNRAMRRQIMAVLKRIPGWGQDGLQFMESGETSPIWVPGQEEAS